MFGFQPGYEPVDSALAPQLSNTLRISAASSSLLASTKLRCNEAVMIWSPSNLTIAKFEDVSTVPSKSFDIAMTPLGYLATASIKLAIVCLSMTLAGISAATMLMLISGSTAANCSFTRASNSATNAANSSALFSGTVTVTNDSRGIALRKLPPWMSAILALNFSVAFNNKAFITLLALARPKMMSMPE